MGTPGICIISPRGFMPYQKMLSMVKYANLQVVKFHIGNSFSTDPIDVEQMIQGGVKKIILRTDDGLLGYSYEKVRALIENPGGVGHFSYASLFKKYPHIEWWIEVGNEPNLAGINGWIARWWSLAVYKELALNYLGHIDIPWKTKYPNLNWVVNLATNYNDAEIMLRYLDNKGKDNVGDGSIIDYYDAISCHMYGDFQIMSMNYDWPKIYQMLLSNQYVKKIHVTEMGINDPHTPLLTKAARYHGFCLSAPPKVDFCMVWCLGQRTGFPTYEIADQQVLKTIQNG